MKITIESEENTVSVTTAGPTAECAVQSCYRALIAAGFGPHAVADWMVEVAQMEGDALNYYKVMKKETK